MISKEELFDLLEKFQELVSKKQTLMCADQLINNTGVKSKLMDHLKMVAMMRDEIIYSVFSEEQIYEGRK
jgi:hypothetical protein